MRRPICHSILYWLSCQCFGCCWSWKIVRTLGTSLFLILTNVTGVWRESLPRLLQPMQLVYAGKIHVAYVIALQRRRPSPTNYSNNSSWSCTVWLYLSHLPILNSSVLYQSWMCLKLGSVSSWEHRNVCFKDATCYTGQNKTAERSCCDYDISQGI